MQEQEIELGDEVRDKITKFSGIVVGRAQYLTGCDQASVLPTVSEPGKYPGVTWFDEARLEVVRKGAVPPETVQAQDRKPGCDTAPPSRPL